jgi:preprotein translocase subunit SecG
MLYTLLFIVAIAIIVIAALTLLGPSLSTDSGDIIRAI